MSLPCAFMLAATIFGAATHAQDIDWADGDLPLTTAHPTGTAAPAHDASLATSNPVTQIVEAAQFGVPRDAKFVFCDGEDCPARTLKHLEIPLPSAPLAPAALPAPLSHPAPSFSTLQAELPKPPAPKQKKPKKKRNKHHVARKPKTDCR